MYQIVRSAKHRVGQCRPHTSGVRQGRYYRPRLEVLEHRRLLSITVNTLADEMDGSIVDGDISLRDAIATAAPGETIDFDAALTAGSPATIELTLGHLTINKNLTIRGPGAHLLTLTSTSRKFNIDDGNGVADKSVAISGLKLTDGIVLGNGAGFRNAENLTVTACTITGNVTSRRSAGRYSYAFDGGGIWNSGNLTLTGSMVSDNQASKNGGGIWNSGILTVTGSTIEANETTSGASGRYATNGGGGIWNSGELTITTSTISGNSTTREGGGIRNTFNLTLIASTISGNSAGSGGGIWSATDLTDYQTTIVSSTISGNTASSRGGGLHNQYGLTVIEFSTFTANEADAGYGSGVSSYSDSSTRVQVRSSIIAGNVNSDIDVDFLFGGPNSFRSEGDNLIGTGNSVGRFNQSGDQAGVANPMLGPLINNGGPTETHAPLAGSSAIDRGDPAAVAGLGGVPAFDQRNFPYVRVYDGDGTGVAWIDIGAFELQPIPLPTVPGDYNENGKVDAADYTVWRSTLGSAVTVNSGADGNGNGVIDTADYEVWKAHFGMTTAATPFAIPVIPSAISAPQPPALPGDSTATMSVINTLPSWLRLDATVEAVTAKRAGAVLASPVDTVFSMIGQRKSPISTAAVISTTLHWESVDLAVTDLPLLKQLWPEDDERASTELDVELGGGRIGPSIQTRMKVKPHFNSAV